MRASFSHNKHRYCRIQMTKVNRFIALNLKNNLISHTTVNNIALLYPWEIRNHSRGSWVRGHCFHIPLARDIGEHAIRCIVMCLPSMGLMAWAPMLCAVSPLEQQQVTRFLCTSTINNRCINYLRHKSKSVGRLEYNI